MKSFATPAIFNLHDLQEIENRSAILHAVRDAIVAHAAGEIDAPEPGHLLFDDPVGDCHVKFARFRNAKTFVVKVATGFYDNGAIGLPVNDGVVALFCGSTGQLLAVFLDQGWLTSWRTAAAGALAAKAGVIDKPRRLGVVGAGHQAELQAIWSSQFLGNIPVSLWSRRSEQSVSLASRLTAANIQAKACADIKQLFATCDVVITCTSAREPLVTTDIVAPGTHIVSLGADGPDKAELEPALFSRAVVAVDDLDQCCAYGDFSRAVISRAIVPSAAHLFGDVLAGRAVLRRRADDITIATLTGTAAADLAIAAWALQMLGWSVSRLGDTISV